MAYNNGKTERSWLCSVASRSVVDGFKTAHKTKMTETGISIEKTTTEGQSEIVEAAARGAAKGAVGR